MSDDIRAAIVAAMESGSGEEQTSEAPSAPESAGEVGGSVGGDSAATQGNASDEPPPQSGSPAASEDGDSSPAKAGRARDGKGRFAPAATEAQEAPATALAAKPAVTPKPPTNGAPAPAQAPQTPPAEAARAPQSWKPAAREHFAKLPAEVQSEVARREKEIAATLQETASARRLADEVRHVVGPYEALIRGEGAEPLQFIQSLLQTAAGLRGPAAPQVIARLVRSLGVPIDALDQALTATIQGGGGQAPGQPQQGAYQDPRVDQLLGAMQQAAHRRQAGMQQQAQADIDGFKANAEFFPDVERRMGALMADAAARKQAMSLQDAYDAACWADKDIRGILQQREAEKAANARNASTQRSRAAASSIKSQPAGASPSPQSGNVVDDVRAAYAALSSR